MAAGKQTYAAAGVSIDRAGAVVERSVVWSGARVSGAIRDAIATPKTQVSADRPLRS